MSSRCPPCGLFLPPPPSRGCSQALSSLRKGPGATWQLLLGPQSPYLPQPPGPGTAMDGQLLPVLLLFLLGASGLQGQGPERPSEDLLEETPGEEVPKEDGVLVLDHHTLGLALQEYPALLVEFFAPWCGHCKALAPEYSKAAALLAAESVTATLAKVDGPAEQELTEEFGVTGYPTLKFFRDGNRTHPEEYTGPREAKGIVEWLKRRVGSSATRLEDEESAQALMDAGDVVVIGFFQDLEDEDVATFLALARDALDMTFGFTDQPKLFQKFGLTKDTVVLFKKFDEGRADFPVDEELGLDLGDLSRFLITHSMLLVTEFSNQTSRRIFGARILNHLLLFVNQTLASHRELLEGFREAAPPLRGQVLFVVVDVDASNDHVLQYFGLKAEEAPTLRLVNIETTKKYAPPGGGPITSASVAAFCQMVFSGKLKPYLLSQEVPPDWDQRPVKTLVGKNFEQVAFDETKNVFVKFYAPWCSHCKEMAPAWEALAEKYRDHEDIIIAELDATANELEAFTVSGFPRLLYFPAGRDRKMMEYKGNRDLESFSKFLDSGGELPAEAPTAPFQEPLANSSVGPREEL
ncbi:protein disulfide-isomerase A2 isoform X4 [Ictidomys tridecemlineatus]|nr:protein disulfide-isomerase A2 isoform X4 [Ictidomys tridecemlineatus]KAG3259316.1 protein disulfide isomerase family A member 2, transcript variant X2 [Ictidomys tridecemlineatus]